MTNGKLTVCDLNESHISDVLRICSQELGPDYHSEDDFKKCLGESGGRFCKVALDAGGRVGGFILALLMGPKSAGEFLKLPDSRERDKLLSAARIGVLDAEAIADSQKGKGLGRLLIHAMCRELLNQDADVICGMAWKTIHGHTNADRILTENGLRAVEEIKGYWNRVVDSPEGHHCPVCLEPPCKCYGVLYVRYAQ